MFQLNFDPLDDAREAQESIRTGLKQMGADIVSDVKASNSFEGGEARKAATKAISLSPTRLQVRNDDEVFAYLELGTKPHPIEAKTAPLLVFQGRNGLVRTRRVNHPGTKATKTLEQAVAGRDLTTYL